MPERPTTIIALTRAHDDREAFAPLVAAGAHVLHTPLLRQVARPPEALARALSEARFTDLVVSSGASVAALEAALGVNAAGVSAAVGLFAVGPATAAALARCLGRPVEAVCAAPDAASLIGLLSAPGAPLAGRRFLFPASDSALRTLPDGLRGLGAALEEVTCYATEAVPEGPERVQAAIVAGVGLWAVASPTAVAALAAGLDALRCPRGETAVAAIGPTTAKAARAAGLRVAVEAREHTMPGLAQAILAWLQAS